MQDNRNVAVAFPTSSTACSAGDAACFEIIEILQVIVLQCIMYRQCITYYCFFSLTSPVAVNTYTSCDVQGVNSRALPLLLDFR